ncbi:MAG TPA: FHA domain-containing protein [Kiritimatiellia bacterium]|nr:FHA domain-containing protein [Kiritimatiellia bacterium]
MDAGAHIVVEVGPDLDKRFTIPADGARVGRSGKNDIELTDPTLSRYHCRFLFQPDGTLAVADLGSTNTTLVNGSPIVEMPLKVGDAIEIGETVLRVIHDRLGPKAAGPVQPPAAPASAPATAVPNLGFGAAPDAAPGMVRETKAPKTRLTVLVLWIALATVALAGVGALLRAALAPPPTQTVAPVRQFELYYEKVQASPQNIFRYELKLEGDTLSVRVDSLAENRHVDRSKRVDAALLASLRNDIERSRVLELAELYQGVAPNSYDLWDLTLMLDRRVHRTRVLNRIEPEAFARARGVIEEFARNELGLAAVSLPPEKLLELARDAVLQGRKFFAEREVRLGNLAAAIRSFEEAQWYLETIEPKPDFFADAVAGLEESRRTMQEQYENHRFQADRAAKLREWETAARHLRIICELIPDRADERHALAARTLLDVERRIKR